MKLKIRIILIPLEGWIRHGSKVDVERCRTHGTVYGVLMTTVRLDRGILTPFN